MLKTIKSKEFKPCPFCGGDPELLIAEQFFNADGNRVQIRCPNCMAVSNTFNAGKMLFGDIVTISEAKRKAVRAWNKRQGGARA